MGVYSLQELLWNDESSFAEYASSPGSATYTNRMAATNISLSVEQAREGDASIQSRQNESRPGYLMPRQATLEFTSYLYGHNTAPTGAAAATQLYTLLKDGLGGGSTSADGGTVDSATAGGATITSASTTWLRGAIYRVGTAAETRGAGQAAVVASVAGDVATMLNLLPGTPNASDQIYGGLQVYPAETAGTTKRFMVGWTETGAQYHLFGCQLESLSFNLPIGGIPTVTLRYRGAYWDRSTVTVPTSNTLETCNVAPIAGGSVFLNSVGTATRAVVSPSSMSLSLDMGLAAKEGPAASQAAYQTINGYERTRCRASFSYTVPWASDPIGYDTDGSDTTHKHVLVNLNPSAGRAVAIYMPRCYPTSPKPVVTESAGLLYQTVNLICREGTDTTSELTKSNFRIYLG
jgi:hypothetical protein